MAGTPLRALVGARVSVLKGPEKVSQLAQIESAKKWALAKGYEIVDTFEDLGVSAGKRPQDRPDLGPWLTEEGAAQWDVIVWSKMDRAFRSTRHCVDFAQWAEERHKIVAFSDDGLVLNYRPHKGPKGIEDMMAELFVYLGSFFAQLELNRFKERALDAHSVLRQMDRWASGVPPLGFKVVDHPSGKGKGLDTDPEGRALLVAMAERLLDGWSFIRIAAWLNESGHLTNMDRARVAAGKPAKARPWTVGTVTDALTSQRTQGLKMTGSGKAAVVVLDGEGEPIRLGPPTFDAETWQQIQAAAEVRKLQRRTPTEVKNPMLGVGVCGCTGCPACEGSQLGTHAGEPICGASMAQQITRRKTKTGVNEHRYYRCGRTPLNCNGKSVKAETVDAALEAFFLVMWGEEEVTRRVFVPGEDHSAELEQVNATIDRLRREADMGVLTTPEDEQVYFERLKAQTAKRDQLVAMPSRAAGWITESTGETYEEVWDTADHRQLLIDAGVRFVMISTDPLRFDRYVPAMEQLPDPFG
ncbi:MULTISPECIES: recombinase family protein [unclassified Mycolicibacterium]|uniref:recombinase family protein n=1 Tax=unclassified Mycolicibacterium TaxID=2636767 RepID=UPI0012DFA760|nr:MULTISPECIES: recombinase family protein [unclassified Mycolicibacterium]MUL85044.1 recombinase family protein [Mycolicibacterium sp. CBMA 329]MUL91011.1 recombinase family protein [Mycolicibacterium sp. CBMA 331]MUL98318.1 recombinase family protein [Mycolicibacterium sp. CBMA 334]MUM29073.1 recombinase family protein [Mycolicibacterium sp. CBMA 295]MUM40770.1 recombinase family protein [Mycolicibacterium sp. CBMA 247]